MKPPANIIFDKAEDRRLRLWLDIGKVPPATVQPRYFVYPGDTTGYAITHLVDALSQLEDLQPMLAELPDGDAAVRALRPILEERGKSIAMPLDPLNPDHMKQLVGALVGMSLKPSADTETLLAMLRSFLLHQLAELALFETPHVRHTPGGTFFRGYVQMLQYLHGAWRAQMREQLRDQLDIDQLMLVIRRMPLDPAKGASVAAPASYRLALVALSPAPGLIPHLPIIEGSYWHARLSPPSGVDASTSTLIHTPGNA